MKVIIAGSRTITDYTLVENAVRESGFDVTEVISGGARGVDKLGEGWAARHGKRVTVILAKWDKFGRSAGHRRNSVMIEQADALIAVWDQKSKGTKDTIDKATKKGLKVFIYNVPLT